MYRYVSSGPWTSPGSYNTSLVKGSTYTTWIWNLHADAHDFDTTIVIAGNKRKVFSSNMTHVSVVLAWLSGMHYHGAYFSNYSVWLKDPYHSLPTAQTVWSIVEQESLLSDTGGYSQGIYITSGLFSLWRRAGILHLTQLKVITIVSGVIACTLIASSYLHMNYLVYATGSMNYKLKVISGSHMASLLGIGSILWTGHLMHVSIPSNRLLEIGIDPTMIPSPISLITSNAMRSLYPQYGRSIYPEFSWSIPSDVSILSVGNIFNQYTGSIYIGYIAAHHYYTGIALIA